MVKNTSGGSKHKGFARKNVVKKDNNVLRVSEDEAEVYAQVTKIFGGASCQVTNLNGDQMLCHIRGKFKGRSKRNSFISMGSIILVGFRHYETPNYTVCDLLEVYTAHEVTSITSLPSFNISSLLSNDASASSADEFLFVNSNVQQPELDNTNNIFMSASSPSSTHTLSTSIDDLIMDI